MSTSAPRPDSPWRIMRPVRGQIRAALLLSAASALLGLGSLAALAMVIQQLISMPRAWPWQAMATAAACVAGSYLARLASFNRSHHAAFALENRLRSALAQHLALVSLGAIERYGAGALSKVMQDDVKALHVFVADSTPLHARAYVTPACTLPLLLWLDWRLATGALAVLVIGFGVLALATRHTADMGRRYNQAREQVSAAIIEFVQAMPVVRNFDGGHASFGRYQEALGNYLDILTRWYRVAGFPARFSLAILNPLPTVLLLVWLGCYLMLRDALGVGQWIAVLLLGAGMAEATMPMMMLRHMVSRAMLSIHRIDEVMALPVLPVPGPGQVARPAPPADASVRFEGVSFAYGASARHDDPAPTLRALSFYAAAGTVTALVGPSGAGKTTVARLILRFWDVQAGRILVGGVDVRDMPTEQLMAQVAYVFQDSFLLADSIANNIRLGMPQASMAQVMAAAAAAQAHDFISALPHGYETHAGERGLFLSGGQRQRIAIARAILQDRPILVLDEVTAFADPESEAAIIAALAELMRGKTVIVVAHRLATIRAADQILVFEHGTLVESGRHDALLRQDRVYARLWRSHETARDWSLKTSPSHASGQPR